MSDSSGRKGRSRRRFRRTVPVFLEKLMSMLETAPSSLICWGKDGSSFIVLNPVRFSKEVLPKFYNTSNFSSFVRQLNFYSFSKVVEEKKGSKKWEFVHKKFLRGRPELLPEIKRKTYQDDDSPKREEFATLQREVHVLNNKVGKLEGELSELRKLLFAFMGGRGETLSAAQSPNKKRKLTKASELANIDLINLVDIDSDGLVTKAGEPMSTEDLAHFLEDLEFGSDSVEKSESTSGVLLHVKEEPGLVRIKEEPGSVRIKEEPGLVRMKEEPGLVERKEALSAGRGSHMDIDKENFFQSDIRFKSFVSRAFPAPKPIVAAAAAKAIATTTATIGSCKKIQLAGDAQHAGPSQHTERPTNTLRQLRKGIHLPSGVSEQDGHKILEALALMMPQIQVALLTQFQAAAAMSPVLSRSVSQRSRIATGTEAQNCGA